MSSQVYFATDGNGRVKIGLSVDPEGRLRGLQTGSGARITLIGSFKGSFSVEKALHERFASRRLVGEWFRSDPGFLDEIADLIASQPRVARPKRLPKPVGVSMRATPEMSQRFVEFLRSQHRENTASHVSAKTGISRKTVAKWFERSGFPSGDAFLALVEAYGPQFLAVLAGDAKPQWLRDAVDYELIEQSSEALSDAEGTVAAAMARLGPEKLARMSRE